MTTNLRQQVERLTRENLDLRNENSYLLDVANAAKEQRWGLGAARDLDSALIAWGISCGELPPEIEWEGRDA